ncbi:predicted protein [Plenodomus lingam JN3]|uniref:Predicted protein n=1 Tax=Leptosphaeria maculans (strain JN3 / isolate v23.1.3 / race Av1-4-5-6-7-8) TaxID=985895 RepID=E5R4V9_LEPMJ|nr:predicted protein [Plenodomus lingam JN3]CBX92232.1 predicted protein [Plenodomus lingam JN3]
MAVTARRLLSGDGSHKASRGWESGRLAVPSQVTGKALCWVEEQQFVQQHGKQLLKCKGGQSL